MRKVVAPPGCCSSIFSRTQGQQQGGTRRPAATLPATSYQPEVHCIFLDLLDSSSDFWGGLAYHHIGGVVQLHFVSFFFPDLLLGGCGFAIIT